MKRIILLIAFCLSLSAIYAQTIDVIHLKSGFDARGTITNRTESQITLQTENGRVLTIDMSDIDSMEQEQKAFDPRVLIGRWAYYKADGERDEKFDIEIRENEGFYTVCYNQMVFYMNKSNTLYSVKPQVMDDHRDIEVDDGSFSFTFYRIERNFIYCGTKNEHETMNIHDDREFNLTFIDGKLKGSVDCIDHYVATGNSNYETVQEALEHGRGKVLMEGPCGRWKCYFVKH